MRQRPSVLEHLGEVADVDEQLCAPSGISLATLRAATLSPRWRPHACAARAGVRRFAAYCACSPARSAFGFGRFR